MKKLEPKKTRFDFNRYRALYPRKSALLLIVILALAIISIVLLLDILVFRPDKYGGQVCGPAIVSEHNQVIKSTINFSKNLSEFSNKIESKPGFNKDITCVFIVYKNYAYRQDVDKTRFYLEQYKMLNHYGKKVNASIIDQKTLFQMEEYTKSLEHNRNIGDRSDGSG